MILRRKAALCSTAAFVLLHALLAPAAAAEPAQRLSLSEALSLAQQQNPDLKLGGLDVESATAAILAADVAPNPTLTLQTANINPQLGVGSGSLRNKTVDTTVRIDQLIERGGKRGLRAQAATELRQAARADLGDVKRQVRLAVSGAYYDLLAAQERARLQAETAALFERTLEAAEKRRKAGDLGGAEVARIQVDALRARNDARQAEAGLNQARQALAQVLGMPPQSNRLEATDAWPEADSGVFSGGAQEVEQLVEQRADVLAARARVDAAASNYRLALAQRTRDVSVGLQYEHYPVSAANPQGSGNSYGISVQIPLFINNYYTGEIRAADVAQESARQLLEKVKNNARHEIAQARELGLAASERVARMDSELLKASEKSGNAAEFAFRNGAANAMEVLDARRTTRATQLEAIDARVDYAKSLTGWRLATAPYAEQEMK